MATAEAPPAALATTEALIEASSETSLEVADPEKKIKKIVRKKRRPARPQVDPATFKPETPAQTGTIFNIWYNKWSGGDREDKYLSKHAAPNRCNIKLDSGYTRADSVAGSYFCLYFARGLCPKGQDCEYLHRLPTVTDIFNPAVDSFGRDKFSGYRDDMGGVGSFLRQNRTLYVGRIFVEDAIEEVVARHFSEWGQIERIRVLPARGVAFVTYTNEANSEFAKEAMAHQQLDHSEILNVRWATVDPNPMAQKREARRIEEQAADAIRAIVGPEYAAEVEGRDPEAKRRRKIEGSFGLQGYEAPDDVWYAKEKAAHVAAQNRGLEAPEERRLIEGGNAGAVGTQEDDEEDGYPDGAAIMPSAPAVAPGGILSGSTLAALNGGGSGVRFTVGDKQKPAPAGPLVGYDSDDDSD